MPSILLIIFAAYLLGLGLFGYVCLLGLLQSRFNNQNSGVLKRNLLTGLHFCFGIAALVIVPGYLYGRFKSVLDPETGVVFGISMFVVLALVFFAVHGMNRIFGKVD